MKGESGLLEVVGLIIDPGDEIINGALAQDARKASVALDGGVVDLDYHLSSQLNHWAGSPSGLDPFHWRRTNLFRFVFLCQRLMVDLLSVACLWAPARPWKHAHGGKRGGGWACYPVVDRGTLFNLTRSSHLLFRVQKPCISTLLIYFFNIPKKIYTITTKY